MHDIIVFTYTYICYIYIFVYIYTQTHANIFISIFRRKVPETPHGGTGKLWGWTHLTSLWRFPLLAKRVCGKTPCFCCRVPLPTEEIWGECLWWKGLTRDCNRANVAVCDYIYIYICCFCLLFEIILFCTSCFVFLTRRVGRCVKMAVFPLECII